MGSFRYSYNKSTRADFWPPPTVLFCRACCPDAYGWSAVKGRGETSLPPLGRYLWQPQTLLEETEFYADREMFAGKGVQAAHVMMLDRKHHSICDTFTADAPDLMLSHIYGLEINFSTVKKPQILQQKLGTINTNSITHLKFTGKRNSSQITATPCGHVTELHRLFFYQTSGR